MLANFQTTIPVIRDNLASSRKYYTQFCHKFVNSFIPKYVNALYKCRLMSTTISTSSSTDSSSNASSINQINSANQQSILGCEQLLLDTHSLKTILLDLPSIGSQVKRKAPASYTKVVIKGMTKAEMIIKVVMQSILPAQTFIEQYLKMLPESHAVEFTKIMDMKGLRRTDAMYLVEIYKRMAPKESFSSTDNVSEKDDGLDDSLGLYNSVGHATRSINSSENSIRSALKQTASNVTSTLAASADKGRIRKLENLIKKRLP